MIMQAARAIYAIYQTFQIVRQIWDMVQEMLLEDEVRDMSEHQDDILSQKRALFRAMQKAETDEERMHLNALYYRSFVQLPAHGVPVKDA